MGLRLINGGKQSSGVSRRLAGGKQSKLIHIGYENQLDYKFNLLDKWRKLLEEEVKLDPIKDKSKIGLIKRRIRIIRSKLNSINSRIK